MKKLILPVYFMAMLHGTMAQQSGKVIYDERVKLNIQLDDAHAKMLENLPKERTSQKELNFSPEASLYQNDKSDHTKQDIDQEAEGGGRIMIKMDQADDKVYCDLKNNKKIEQRDFMSRKFLIESDLTLQKWKLTGNQKMILNYPCQEAILQDTSKDVRVWFTPSIHVSTGPNGYANLPGLVLAAEIDSGKVTITATMVELKEMATAVFVKPTEGKKMTKEAFNKMMEEKRKEMMEENGGKGDVIIKIRN